jgi:hypothetical protein
MSSSRPGERIFVQTLPCRDVPVSIAVDQGDKRETGDKGETEETEETEETGTRINRNIFFFLPLSSTPLYSSSPLLPLSSTPPLLLSFCHLSPVMLFTKTLF